MLKKKVFLTKIVVGYFFVSTSAHTYELPQTDSTPITYLYIIVRILRNVESLSSGKLKVCDSEWIQVIFEPPEFKVGPFEIRYGGESEVMLQITYIDEKIRLGKGSKGSLFVFRRRN